MYTVRRTRSPEGGRSRHVRTVVVAATAAVATLGALGLSAPALAQSHILLPKTVNVPAGVATGIDLTACPSGNTATFTSSSPALPTTETAVANKNVVKLIGVWPTTPASYTASIKCSGGTTVKTTVAVAAAPPENSAVGLGAQTQQSLVDQFSGDYNATLKTASVSHLYNYDAINPVTGAIGDTITVKTTCASFPRPDGASAGIKQLDGFEQTSDKKFYCDNFANDSRNRSSSDPPYAPGGLAFTALAGDAVDWATPATTDAPKTLTTAQLNAIFTCADTNWSQVGGKNAPIKPFLPQTGAGTLTFWLAAIGVTTPGPCVSNNNNTLEENQGVDPVLQTPEAIWIYSVGDWIAQKFHSSKCTVSACTGTPPCVPAAGKNQFGCDVHGTYVVKEINGIAPTTGKGTATAINPSFPSAFDRILYEVVPFDPNTADHIPGSESGAPGGVNLETLFGSSGWACTSAAAKTDIKDYGFVAVPSCGTTS
jgi:ABC-type phosphate transport system substrate-binding protein